MILVKFTSGQVRNAMPRELTELQFYNQKKSWEEREFLYLSWVNVMLPSSCPPPGWAGESSCPYVVKLGPQITSFHGWREHVLGLINLLSSLAGCGPHATLSYCVRAGPGLLLNGFVAKPACLVLWLSNPAFSVIINFQGSLKFSVNTSPVGVTV